MPEPRKALQRAFRAICWAFWAVVHELRDALRDNGTPSWSRLGSAIIVCTWCYVFIRIRAVPERTEQAALLVAALYGANQFKSAFVKLAQLRQDTQTVSGRAATNQSNEAS